MTVNSVIIILLIIVIIISSIIIIIVIIKLTASHMFTSRSVMGSAISAIEVHVIG